MLGGENMHAFAALFRDRIFFFSRNSYWYSQRISYFVLIQDLLLSWKHQHYNSLIIHTSLNNLHFQKKERTLTCITCRLSLCTVAAASMHDFITDVITGAIMDVITCALSGWSPVSPMAVAPTPDFCTVVIIAVIIQVHLHGTLMYITVWRLLWQLLISPK